MELVLHSLWNCLLCYSSLTFSNLQSSSSAPAAGSLLEPVLGVRSITGSSECWVFANSAVRETISKKQHLQPKQGIFQLNGILPEIVFFSEGRVFRRQFLLNSWSYTLYTPNNQHSDPSPPIFSRVARTFIY